MTAVKFQIDYLVRAVCCCSISHEDVRLYPREGVLLMPRLKRREHNSPFFLSLA